MEKANIPWVKIGGRLPTNANRIYEGQPDTPFIPCLIWICNPDYIHGGLIETIRWSSDRKDWCREDVNPFWLSDPYKITHFCETEALKGPHEC
jgi:hypothetical protein